MFLPRLRQTALRLPARAGTRVMLLWAPLLAGWLSTDLAMAQRPTLTAQGEPNAGYVTLSWGASMPRTFQLQEAADEAFTNFRVRYQGRHTSTVVSGLPDGSYYFRVRYQSAGGAWSPWSKTIAFHVRHHSLVFAGALFGLGAFVFAATALFIARAKEEL